jgi:hypothetical protein
MKAITRIILILFGIFLTLFSLSAPVFAYTIVGDSVIQEDAVSRLQVTPHTASNPTGKDFVQTFVLTNKTASPQNVYVAYKFDKNLLSGSVNAYTPPVFDWVENQSYTCAPPLHYTYVLNANPGAPNPNSIHCYKTLDNNTPANPADDTNVTAWDMNFSTGDLGTNSIAVNNYVKVSGDTWTDVTNFFSSAIYLNDTLYYLPTPIAFSANQSLTWKLKYTPDPSDATKKWEMVFYTGTSASCLLTGTCTYVQWLDPWWNSSYLYGRTITVTNNSGTYALQDTNNSVRLRITNELGAKALANCNDVRITYNGTEIDRNAVGNCQSDANIYFEVQAPINASATDAGYFLYYGNTGAGTPNTATLSNPATDSVCVGQYRMDAGYAKNECGADATLTGTGSVVAGVLNNAYQLGSTSLINVGAPMKSARTIEGWFNCGSACSTADNFISGGNFGTDKFTQAYVNGGLQWSISPAGSNAFTILGATTLSANTWYYIALSCGVGGAKMYVNGVLDGNNASTVCFPDIDDPLTTSGFGYATTSGANIFDSMKMSSTQRTSGWWQSTLNSGAVLPSASLGAEQNANAVPDINFIYPNTSGALIAGTHNIDFNFNDADFNASGNYKINIKARRTDTNALTTIMTDGNAFAYCSHMDSNAQKKECLVSYNFSLNLASSVRYVLDVNVTDDLNAVGSKTSLDFNVLKVVIWNQKMVRTNLLNLDADGVNYGINSEGWSASETQNKTMNAPNVGRKQYVILKKLRDNSALEVFINSVSVGTIVADSGDPKTWQLYAFPVTSTLLHGNPQTVTITAPGGQNATFIDYIALADSVDGNIFSGGEALTYLWDVNYNGITSTSNQFGLDQNGVITYTDANSVAMTADNNYVAVVYPTASLDMNVFGFVKVVAGGATYLSDTNKTMINDSTNPVITSISMSYFDVITGRSYHFDSNTSDLYWNNAILSIEGVDYDLNVQSMGGNDRNAYGNFTFVADGNYSSSLQIFDQVDRNTVYAFGIRASNIQLLSSNEFNDSNWARANATTISSTATFTSVSFRKDFNFTATGTANITYFDHNYSLYNGTTSTGRGGVINSNYYRANKSTVALPPLTTLNGYLVASDMNGNVSLQDYISYDVNGAIETQWKNTGIDDKRLVWVSPQDINSSLTGFWVKVAVRTPFNANTYKVLFKECTDTPDFSAGTCVSYTTIDIYSQTDQNYNGGVYPTVDADLDGLKDTLYFKVPALANHMYLIDLTATPESAWTGGGGTPNTGGGGGGGSSGDSGTPDTNNIVQQATTGLANGFDGFASALGTIVGNVIDWTNLQFTRLNVQGVFQGENLFTIISLAVLGVIVFFLIPKAQSKTTKKSFGVRV